jgi:hypothetical protein
MTSILTNEEYDARKLFLEDLKLLSKTEHEHIFELLKADTSDYSENSNGIFFDVCKISQETFVKLQAYIKFCMEVRKEQASRDEDERKAQDMLR